MVGNDGRYDNPFWEYHLPVNPPIDLDKPVLDGGDPSKLYEYDGPLACYILNWNGPGGLEYRPRVAIGTNERELLE